MKKYQVIIYDTRGNMVFRTAAIKAETESEAIKIAKKKCGEYCTSWKCEVINL